MGNNPAPGQGENYEPEATKPQTNTPVDDNSTTQNNQLITLTQDQFNALLDRLNTGSTTDKAAAPSMTPGIGLQVNPFGQAVGTFTKFNIDPDFYPNPVEALLTEFDEDRRMRRFNLRENYFITFDMTAKPYQTKDNLSIQEPTFHMTLYMNMFDDQGEETGKAIVVQTLHMNEDEELTRIFASEEGIEVTDEGLRELMDKTRYERAKRWLLNIFFPPRNFQLNVDSTEEAIGGSVVKVVTKSNVKGFGNPTPKIEEEELQ
jgi:replicative DNA helicase